MSCRQEIPSYVPLDCDFEKGRVNAMAYIIKEKAEEAIADNTLLSDPTWWTTVTNPGDVLIHKEVSGTYAAAETTIPGRGNQQNRLGGFNHTTDLQVDSIKGNEDYWNKLNISTDYYQAIISDNYNLLLFSTVACGIMGRVTIEDSLESVIFWQVVTSWSDISNPITSDVPVGIFN